MFKLHDKTRRFLTLLIFIMLGPALLFVVVTRGCSRHSVRTVAEWETLLTDTLGQRVEIESVRFPVPGVVRFSQMRVIHPETNGVFLQIPQWELIERFGEMPHSIGSSRLFQADDVNGLSSLQEETSTNDLDDIRMRTPYKRGLFASFGFALSNLFGKQPRYLHCEIPKISCDDTAVPLVKDALLALMAKQPGSKTNRSQTNRDIQPMVLFVGAIDVFCTDGKPGNPTFPAWDATARQPQMMKTDDVTIADACFEFRPAEEQTTFLAIFQQADQPTDAKPFQLAISRWRHPVALTRVQFMSGDNEVPNRILTGLDPFFAAFGQESRFHGNIIAENSINSQKHRTRSLELNQVAFSNVALDSLLGKSLPFRLDGTADAVMLDSVRYYGEPNDADALRLEHVRGRMYSARGLVSWPGLCRLVQGTKLQISPENASPPDTDIYFRNGTFAFQIDPEGIRLHPAVDESQQRLPLMMIDNHCAVFVPNSGDVIRYVDFLASLAQPGTQHIPLMPETQYLISILPMTAERDITVVNAPFPQVPPINPVDISLHQQPQPQSAWQQEEMQSAAANRDSVPTLLPVPSLTHDKPLEQYHQQYQPQLAMGDIPNGNGSWQPNSSISIQRIHQEDSYTPMQRPSESQFGMQQNSFHQAALTSPSALQPIQQPTQSMFMPLQTSQSNGGAYVGHSQHLMVVNQPPNRVVIPTLSGNSNRVQTGRELITPGSFNNETPALFDPYQQMQVASAPQSPRYDNMPMTTPSAATLPGQSSPGPFELWETNPQNNR